jgi:hypothetical protein
VCNGEYLRPANSVFGVDQRVRKSIEVIHAQITIDARSAARILDEQIPNAFIFGKKRLSNAKACMLRLVHRSVAEFCFGVWVNPVTHEIRALTRASASSPGTIAAFPPFTSAWRWHARSIHARCADDCGSKLAMSRSSRRARSSAGRLSTS